MDAIRQQFAERGVEFDEETDNRFRRLGERGEFAFVIADEGFRYAIWRPNSSRNLSTTAIVMSRPGRQLDRKDALFRVLRVALSQLNPDRQCVLSAEGTAAHPFVSRACELFGIPLLGIHCAKKGTSLATWLQRIDSHGEPVLHVLDLNGKAARCPLRDYLEVMNSDQLLALHLRDGGNLHQLVRQRLAARRIEGRPSRVFLSLGNGQLVEGSLAGQMMDLGAIGWLPLSDEPSACPLASETVRPSAPILRSLNQANMLTHCTRRADGPWPDQAEIEYLDDLILGDATDRSCLASLIRIITMQRLIATHVSVRGDTSVVSFTTATLDELAKMRTFRAHRGRWDFEPYGISIDRELLKGLGGQEVTYGDESVWDAMSETARPFFQKVDDDSIDWRIEREWRVIGDVDLSSIPADKAIVFVPSEEEAKLVARISRWPVVIRE